MSNSENDKFIITCGLALTLAITLIAFALTPSSNPQKQTAQVDVSIQININTASRDDFDLLPQIGPTLANTIILDREKNGPFESLNQLTRVRGIGPATLKRISPFITIK